MLSVSLPFRDLLSGTGLGSERFLRKLAEIGVGSVELRVVLGFQDPGSVYTAAERVWNSGMRISVHTAPRSADSAIREIFDPLKEILGSGKQEDTILVLHPVNGNDVIAENRRMLQQLTDYVRGNGVSVKLALENNRRMPDKSEGDCAGLVMRLIRDADPEVAGICFDFGHYAWATRIWEQPDPLPPPEAFTSRVIHTHIHALAGAELAYTTHFPLQAGSLPLQVYADSFREHYNGVWNLELEPERFSSFMSGEEAILGSVEIMKLLLP